MATYREERDLFSCIFCRKSKKDGLKLIGGNGVYVCEECIRNSYDLLNRITDEDERRAVKSIPKPAEIKQALDEYVVAQERAKRILSVAVYSHFRRLESADRLGLAKGGGSSPAFWNRTDKTGEPARNIDNF